MTVELTKKEAMWIIDKAEKTCARGELIISGFTDEQLEKDKYAKDAVKEAREILEAVATLGQKIANAIEKELDK